MPTMSLDTEVVIMARFRRALILGVSSLLLLQTGCLVSTRRLRQVQVPSAVMSANADQLVKIVNDHCSDIHSMTAVVDFQLTEGGPRKGREKTYTSFRGYILERNPDSLRVVVQLPVVGTVALDMATRDGTFKLFIPLHNEVFVGSNTVTKVSPNPLENFRPAVFANSLSLSCIGTQDLVTLTSETKTHLDSEAKHLIAQPDYDLMVVRRKQNSQELVPERVIHFSRIDLRPYQEDMYDEEGAIQTDAIYGPLQTYDGTKFPKTIVIKRPLEEMQILIRVNKLTVNTPLTDDKFELKIPEGTTVRKLD